MDVKKLQSLDPNQEELPDSELFARMQQKETNKEEARRAFNEFYRRYKDYLWKVCLYACRKKPEGEELAKDIFQYTFEKVFTSPPLIRKEGRSSIKALLGRIAQNELIDHYRKYQNETPLLEGSELYITDTENRENEVPLSTGDIARADLEKALDELSEQEKHVLFTYMNYFQPDNPNGHLPKSEIERLCKIYNTTPDNLRQIKRRTLLKIKRLLA